MNTVTLFGRVDDRLSPRNIPGTDGMRFQLMVAFRGKDGQLRESGYPVVCWGVSELPARIEPGVFVFVAGRLQNRSYMDADGNKKWSMEVVTGSSGITLLCATEDGKVKIAEADGSQPSENDKESQGKTPF